MSVAKNSMRKHEAVVGYLLIVPFVFSFIVFFLYPALYSLILSFFRYNGYSKAIFVGIGNYLSIIKYDVFWQSMYNVFFYFIIHLPPLMIISFLLAVIINSKIFGTWGKIYKAIIFLPQVTAVVAASLVWRVILSTQSGVINQIFGTQIEFVDSPMLMKLSVILLIVWRSVGYYMVIYLSGLTRISDEIIQASMIDGASFYQRITRIIIPMMAPIFKFTFFIDIVFTLKMFSEPNLLIGIYSYASVYAAPVVNQIAINMEGGSFGTASAVGWMLFIIILAFTTIQLNIFREK